MFRRLLSILFCDVLCIGEFCGRSRRIERKMTSLNLKATDPESILTLLQDLADVPCDVVQQKLNGYVSLVYNSLKNKKKIIFIVYIHSLTLDNNYITSVSVDHKSFSSSRHEISSIRSFVFTY